ncbi:hypothetical protein D046_4865B, partial [Vibrio parahaemolyticus V-223/04]
AVYASARKSVKA